MIRIYRKEDCCGCSACASICPAKCISMVSDSEGFLYPEIDASLCVNCDLCSKVCPIKNVDAGYTCKKDAYLVQHKDRTILRESTSGGAFTPIAKYIIEKNGVVFGAAFAGDSWQVKHVGVETEEELSRFRSSKYVQSDIADTYKQAKEELDKGRWVCFSGTPCQIYGLKQFLRRVYEKLITVDVECRAVPSPLVFQKYMELQNKHFIKHPIKNVRFRDKYYGYSYSTFSIYTRDGKKEYHKGIESDLYLRTFFSGICDRPACGECKFRTQFHRSDFTIWDCFRPEIIPDEMIYDLGISRMSVNSDKGRSVFDEIKDDFHYTENHEVKINERAYQEKVALPRKEFFEDIHVMYTDVFFQKYFPETPKVKMLGFVRQMTYRTGTYKFAKSVWNKVKYLKG